MTNISKEKIRERVYEIIFEADTPAGKLFDIVLLILISMSILVVMLESVSSYATKYGTLFHVLEWCFTIIFTLEYILRLITVKRAKSYAFSFFGIIDLISTLPTYLGLFFIGAHSLLVLRSLRLLRVFRIFKLARFLGAASNLSNALKASRAKITVFLVAVCITVVIMGTIMYLVEGGENGFLSIPSSIYWAIVTLTTVGYGDIAPVTVLGKSIASIIMIMGYGIIAVPTGIVSAELVKQDPRKVTTQTCPECLKEGHEKDAIYCKFCGTVLN